MLVGLGVWCRPEAVIAPPLPLPLARRLWIDGWIAICLNSINQNLFRAESAYLCCVAGKRALADALVTIVGYQVPLLTHNLALPPRDRRVKSCSSRGTG